MALISTQDATLPRPSARTLLEVRSTFNFKDFTVETRPMGWDDLESLRLWKNLNRQYFSHRAWISPEDQAKWYTGFRNDPDAEILVGLVDQLPAACVGFRVAKTERLRRSPPDPKHPREVELFNLICGNPSLLGQGFMSAWTDEIFLQLGSRGFETVFLCVLKSNERATRWYKGRGFTGYGEDTECEFLQKSLTGTSRKKTRK